MRKQRLRKGRWLAKTSDVIVVKCSFMTTLRLGSKLAESVVSISLKHKPLKGENWKEEKLQEVVNTLQHESTDHLLNLYCWNEYYYSFAESSKAAENVKCGNNSQKIKYQTSKHLIGQESTIFLGPAVSWQNCLWYFQAWKCLSKFFLSQVSRIEGLDTPVVPIILKQFWNSFHCPFFH